MTIYLGENIKRLRREKELTQENLALFLGVTFQSVSKWERGESYPDITMLPEIADFFKVSVDELLGVNKAKDEAELIKMLEEHDNLHWDINLMWDSVNKLIEKYPNDFRVQLRYMSMLLTADWDTIAANGSKILSIYENIQRNCTDDSVRIAAKTRYISYLHRMAAIKDSDITFEDAEKIINELPKMEDCQEMYCFIHEYYHKTPEKVHETIETFILETYGILSSWYFKRDKFPLDYQIEIHENALKVLDYIYNDGNYGKAWKAVISGTGILGWYYYEKGEFDNALEKLRKAAELAVKFDSLDRFSTLHSTLLEGKIFDKHSCDSDFDARKYFKKLLTDNSYGFSDDFIHSAEYKEIIAILE